MKSRQEISSKIEEVRKKLEDTPADEQPEEAVRLFGFLQGILWVILDEQKNNK